MRPDIAPGGTFPDYELPAAFHPKILVANTRVATVTPDKPRSAQEFRDAVGARWPFLTDPGRTVKRDLDIEEYTDPADDRPRLPRRRGDPGSPNCSRGSCQLCA